MPIAYIRPTGQAYGTVILFNDIHIQCLCIWCETQPPSTMSLRSNSKLHCYSPKPCQSITSYGCDMALLKLNSYTKYPTLRLGMFGLGGAQPALPIHDSESVPGLMIGAFISRACRLQQSKCLSIHPSIVCCPSLDSNPSVQHGYQQPWCRFQTQ